MNKDKYINTHGTGRPEVPGDIYKHGRLKTAKEMGHPPKSGGLTRATMRRESDGAKLVTDINHLNGNTLILRISSENVLDRNGIELLAAELNDACHKHGFR